MLCVAIKRILVFGFHAEVPGSILGLEIHYMNFSGLLETVAFNIPVIGTQIL